MSIWHGTWLDNEYIFVERCLITQWTHLHSMYLVNNRDNSTFWLYIYIAPNNMRRQSQMLSRKEFGRRKLWPVLTYYYRTQMDCRKPRWPSDKIPGNTRDSNQVPDWWWEKVVSQSVGWLVIYQWYINWKIYLASNEIKLLCTVNWKVVVECNLCLFQWTIPEFT
jgi:hypothetical protein